MVIHKRAQKACLHCNHLKMKCVFQPEQESCERCKKRNIDCAFKPREKRLGPQPPTLYNVLRRVRQLSKVDQRSMAQKLMNELEEENSEGRIESSSENIIEMGISDSKEKDSKMDNDVHSLPDVIEPQIFSLQPNVTKNTSNWTNKHQYNQRTNKIYEYETHLALEQVMTLQEAEDSFQYFLTTCLPHVGYLDPETHTFHRLSCQQDKSSEFLLTCICCVSFFLRNYKQSDRRQVVLNFLNSTVQLTIESKICSVEVVQAFLTLHFWSPITAVRSSSQRESEAELTANAESSHTFSTLAVRMAIDLKLYNVTTHTLMEISNRQRTWFICLAVDKNVSLARNLPCIIPDSISTSLRNSDEWFRGPGKRVWDVGVSGLCALFIQFDRSICELKAQKKSSHQQLFATLDKVNEELSIWKEQWSQKNLFTSCEERYEMLNNTFTSSQHQKVLNCDLNFDEDNSKIKTLELRWVMVNTLTSQAVLRYNYAILVLNSYVLGILESSADCNTLAKSEKVICIRKSFNAAENIIDTALQGFGHRLFSLPHTQIYLVSYACIFLIKILAYETSIDVSANEIIQKVIRCANALQLEPITPDQPAWQHANNIKAIVASVSGSRVKYKAHQDLVPIITPSFTSSSSPSSSTISFTSSHDGALMRNVISISTAEDKDIQSEMLADFPLPKRSRIDRDHDESRVQSEIIDHISVSTVFEGVLNNTDATYSSPVLLEFQKEGIHPTVEGNDPSPATFGEFFNGLDLSDFAGGDAILAQLFQV